MTKKRFRPGLSIHLPMVAVLMVCCLFTHSDPPLKRASNEIFQGADIRGGTCSSICLVNDGYSVFGANMDTHKVEDGLIVFTKKGVTKTGLWKGTTGKVAHWTSKYASIIFSLAGFERTWAGMNEKGLTISTMALYDDTISPSPDERPYLPYGVWLQYIMDTCETIQDVFAAHSEIRIETLDHYLLADRNGNCATLEFLEGKMVVHTGADLPVSALTNSPYSIALQAWLENRQSGEPCTRYRRFCTAADLVHSFRSTDHNAAIQYAFDTLYSVRSERFYPEGITQWNIVFDTKNLRAYFRTASYPQIRYIDLHKIDFSCHTGVKMLDIQADWPGDTTDNLLDFSYDLAFYVMRNFYTKWGSDVSDEYIHFWIRYCLGFPCSD